MTNLERLEDHAISQGAEIIYMQLPNVDGLCIGKTIFISPNLTEHQKFAVLSEELAHMQYTVGDISSQDTVEKRKSEYFARQKAYEVTIPFDSVIALLKAGEYLSDIAERFELPEDYISEALAWYQTKRPVTA